MGLAALLFQSPITFLILTIPLLYSVIMHEIAHGWAAYAFGDDTARRSGRLSLNPLSHLDPIGTLALFLAGFGWAKPVPVNYANMRNFRAGLIVVSMAGCAANIAIATVALFALQFEAVRAYPAAAATLYVLARINIMLGAFNLIPIPPLDGSRILLAILPERAQIAMVRLEPYGLLMIFGLLFSGLLNPVIAAVQSIILLFIKTVLGI